MNTKKIKVGVLSDNLLANDTSTWLTNLLENLDPERFELTGIALTEWEDDDDEVTGRLAKLVNIYGPVITDGGKCQRGKNGAIERPGPNASTGIGVVCTPANILLALTTRALGLMTNFYRDHYSMKTVVVAHDKEPGTMAEALGAGTHFVATSHESAHAFEPAISIDQVKVISSRKSSLMQSADDSVDERVASVLKAAHEFTARGEPFRLVYIHVEGRGAKPKVEPVQRSGSDYTEWMDYLTLIAPTS